MRAGVITQRELERQLRLAIESVVFELLSWQEGFFSFEERAVADVPLDARIRISTESLLMEGARRIDEWSRIADKVPSLSVVPMLAAVEDDRASVLDLLPHEWEVLMMIDTSRDLRGIAAALGRSEFEVAKIAYGLVSTGVVELYQGSDAASVGRGVARRRAAARARACGARRRVARKRRSPRRAPRSRSIRPPPRRGCSPRARSVGSRAIRTPWRSCGAPCRAIRSRRRCTSTSDSRRFASATSRARTRAGSTILRLAPNAPDAGRARAALETVTRLMHLAGGARRWLTTSGD